MSDVLGFVIGRLVGLGRQGRSDALESLDTGAFIQAKQVLIRVLVDLDDVFHLLEEEGIGDLQEVLALMRPQGVGIQKPMQTGSTDRTLEDFWVVVEIALSPTKAPPAASRQRIVLAIEGDDTWGDLSGNGVRSSAAGMIQNALSSLKSLLPTGHGSRVTSHHATDPVLGHLVQQQHSDFQTMQEPGCEGEAGRVDLAFQHVCIDRGLQPFDRFFFRSAKCAGREVLMRERPRAETW